MKRTPKILSFGLLLLAAISNAQPAQAAKRNEDKPAAPTAPAVTVAGYDAVMLPANIASTVRTGKQIEVFGEPRMSKGHPCTLWDQEDIDLLKKNLKTDKRLQDELSRLKADMDKRIAAPLGVPEPDKNQADREGWKIHENNARAISDLGTVYALTGEAKYGEYARKMLVAYAVGFPKYAHGAEWTPQKYRSAMDHRLTGQFLADGFWLCHVAFGYDLVYNLPSWTPEERKLVKDDLLWGVAKIFYLPYPADPHMMQEYISGPHNRSALCCSGALMAGYASDNEELVNIALYGAGGSAKDIKGGVLGMHFSPKCITPDGLWLEGSIGYQVGIASCGLFNDAETLWHHGIDLYRYQGGALKRMLDSAIGICYPDKRMTLPVLHDSAGRDGGLSDDAAEEGGDEAAPAGKQFTNNEPAVPYELGYRRYRDPQYIPVFTTHAQQLSMTVHAGPPSPFIAIPDAKSVPPRAMESANFKDVGYGVLRVGNQNGGVQLLMEYGPSGSHGHPSKLAIDMYALGDSVMPMCGVYFPYDNPLDKTWFHTTLANCVLAVDGTSQIYNLSRFRFKSLPDPAAWQLVFGHAVTMGIQKAWSNTLYPFEVTQDRALFLTPQYYADIFGAFSNSPHQYDMAWHVRGKMNSSTLKGEPTKFPETATEGYSVLADVSHAKADEAWTASLTTRTNKPLTLLAAAVPGTEVFFGKGHLNTKPVEGHEMPPTIIQRREHAKEALFGNVTDISTAGYVKSLTQEGNLQSGYGLLKVQTIKGTDLCFTSYRPGNWRVGDLETDAQQAMVLMDGANLRAMYLGGGKTLKAGNAAITRSEPGLAYVEKLENGNYIVANPSSTAAQVIVTMPALTGLKAFSLDGKGQRTGPATIQSLTASSFGISLEPGAKVEFAQK